MKGLIVSFNGDSQQYVARALGLTGQFSYYLIDGECETIDFIRENFTILGEQ